MTFAKALEDSEQAVENGWLHDSLGLGEADYLSDEARELLPLLERLEGIRRQATIKIKPLNAEAVALCLQVLRFFA
jgi:hypothetical protein